VAVAPPGDTLTALPIHHVAGRHSYIDQGLFRATRINGRLRVFADDIADYIARNKIPPRRGRW